MRTLSGLWIAVVGVAAISFGCEQADEVHPGPPLGQEPQTTRERLVDGARTFAIWADESTVQVTARINRGSRWDEQRTTLDLAQGYALVQAEGSGAVTLQRLDLWLDDVVIGKDVILPDGIHLSDLHAHLERPAPCDHVEWTVDDEACSAGMPASLTLEWSLMVDGVSHPLADQALEDLRIDLDVFKVHGLELGMTAVAGGTFWTWGGMVELADLEVQGSGNEIVPMSN